MKDFVKHVLLYRFGEIKIGVRKSRTELTKEVKEKIQKENQGNMCGDQWQDGFIVSLSFIRSQFNGSEQC